MTAASISDMKALDLKDQKTDKLCSWCGHTEHVGTGPTWFGSACQHVFKGCGHVHVPRNYSPESGTYCQGHTEGTGYKYVPVTHKFLFSEYRPCVVTTPAHYNIHGQYVHSRTTTEMIYHDSYTSEHTVGHKLVPREFKVARDGRLSCECTTAFICMKQCQCPKNVFMYGYFDWFFTGLKIFGDIISFNWGRNDKGELVRFHGNSCYCPRCVPTSITR